MMLSINFIKLIIKISGFLLKPFNYKGLYRVIKFFNLITSVKLTSIDLGAGQKFVFNLNDPYWSILISKSFTYEEEILHYKEYLFEKIESEVMFLDLGSNIGYWSIKFSSYLNSDNVIAVEPNPLNNNIHKLNQYINGIDYLIFEKAVTSKDGDVAKLVIDNENVTSAGSYVSDSTNGKEFIHVETISIPSVLKSYPENLSWVVKLDIEGAEIDALNFLENYKKNNLYLIYEDHGKDRYSNLSKYLLNLDFKILYWEKNRIIDVSLEDINKIKKNKKKGYNFLAIKA
jgi:FkbM family methyltransferase|tara:strand:+ start:664 stop:1524 length:861 start_codon:yes stop_codon:yes gene_type:complete